MDVLKCNNDTHAFVRKTLRGNGSARKIPPRCASFARKFWNTVPILWKLTIRAIVHSFHRKSMDSAIIMPVSSDSKSIPIPNSSRTFEQHRPFSRGSRAMTSPARCKAKAVGDSIVIIRVVVVIV